MLDHRSLGLSALTGLLEMRQMNTRFSLSTLEKMDEDSIVELISNTFMRFSDEEEILASTRLRLPQFFRSYREAGASYLVLKDVLSSNVIGGVGICAFAGLDPEENLGEIRELVIDHRYRGLGLGRTLLAAATEKARILGYRRLYLAATSEMRHAQALFQRSGFRPLEARQGRESFPSYFVREE